MHSKLAGHTPLQDLIQSTISSARTKMAAADEKEKVKKLVEYEKKEHGGKIPSEKEEKEEKEKMSSVINPTDPDEIEKLAMALDAVGDSLIKEADEHNIGGEKPQGGMVLPVASPNAGKQSYKKDKSKSHNVPEHTPEVATVDNPGAANSVDTNMKAPAGLHSPYPKKGVLKTAADAAMAMLAKKKEKDEKESASEKDEKEKKSAMNKCSCAGAGTCAYCKSMEKKSAAVLRLEAAIQKVAAQKKTAAEEEKESASEKKPSPFGEKKAPPFGKKEEKKEDEKEKKSSQAVNFILGKIAEYHGGGETLDSPSGQGPKPESGSAGGNDARSNISSASAAINMKKVDGKKPQKRMLSEVLTEPALSKAHDSKVQDNLRNATAGGVKIAMAKEALAQIAADPNDPRHEALKSAIAKTAAVKKDETKGMKSTYVGTGADVVSPASGTPTPNPI